VARQAPTGDGAVRSEDKMLVSGDGIHSWVPELQEPQKHRLIWASSPDRGLDVLLTWWPAILKKWKDAELHVFYGWNNYDQMMQMYPEMATFKEHVLKLLAQPGVTLHGRIGQKELAAEFAKSQFWVYPSIRADGKDWHETYCITAMEAQANGCIPSCGPWGASGARRLQELAGQLSQGQGLHQAAGRVR